jgi:tetratricopeptide (TPR) repeat protein
MRPPSRSHRLVARLAFAPIVFAAAFAQAAPDEIRALLATTPADSLVEPLLRLEGTRARPAEGADAVMVLGALHFARGEYREAVNAYSRAAARLDPARKSEARYWAGLSWLGLGEPTQARSALEEVVRGGGARRVAALLGLAQAWELSQRPERALEVLEALLHDDLGEVGPAILERAAALAEHARKLEQARRARERLLRDYPRSIEAAAARLALARAADPAGASDVAVVIGSFVDRARARSLATEAKRSGFPGAQVVTRGEGLAAVHIVRLGTYPNHAEARRAGEQATSALGVAYQIVRSPG